MPTSGLAPLYPNFHSIQKPLRPAYPFVGTSIRLPALVDSVTSTTFVECVVAPPIGKGSAGVPQTPQPSTNQHNYVGHPVRPFKIECKLATHPDKGLVFLLVAGLTNGYNIGYQGPHLHFTACHFSMGSTHAHNDEFLAKECLAGRTAGSYSQPPLPNLHYSGLGVVPKKDGDWRVICHLLAPTSKNTKDFIDQAFYSLHYCTIDAALTIINAHGPNSIIGKVDLKDAFRLIPIHKVDWHLLGIHWQCRLYVEKHLQFGLQLSPTVLKQLTTAVKWILHHNCRSTTSFITWMIFNSKPTLL